MNTAQIKLYDLFRRELKLPDDKARLFVEAVKQVVEEESQPKNNISASKEFVKDEIHRLEIQLYKAIFWSGFVQLIAVLGGVLAIVKFIMGK